jgi:hypothetical protein
MYKGRHLLLERNTKVSETFVIPSMSTHNHNQLYSARPSQKITTLITSPTVPQRITSIFKLKFGTLDRDSLFSWSHQPILENHMEICLHMVYRELAPA